MWPFNYTMMLLLNPISFIYMEREKSNENLIVETNYGKVLGSTDTSRNDRTYFEYLGIPYARPPVGQLRYAHPLPPEPWHKIRDATAYGKKCAQISLLTRSHSGSEDCLFLNIYTHQIQNNNTEFNSSMELHPVIVYLHGGAFMGGSGGKYGAKYMMDHDVVFVTINYRLASFGFLNIGDEEAQGNMGLKDQVAALRWVQENIEYFGGDPRRVTLVGQSAGGACAHLHMLSKLSRGLFHKVISQSATAFAPWAMTQHPIEQAYNLAAKLNCTRSTPKEVIGCLRSLNASVILKVHLDSMHFIHEPSAVFRPTVELLNNNQTFISDTPFNLTRRNQMARVPFLTGVNSNEGLVFAAPLIRNSTIRKEVNTNWNKRAPQIFGYDHEETVSKNEISAKIRAHYLQDQEISMSTLENVTNMLTDRNWFQGIHTLASFYRDYKIPSPLYLYYYTYQGQFSLGKIMFGMTMDLPVMSDIALSSGREWFTTKILRRAEVHYGAGHNDEVFLLYKMPYQNEHKIGSKDYEMSKTMVKLWISFATDGKPSHTNDNDTIRPEIWSPMNDKTTSTLVEMPLQYFRLDKYPQLIDEPFHHRMQFLNSLNILFPSA